MGGANHLERTLTKILAVEVEEIERDQAGSHGRLPLCAAGLRQTQVLMALSAFAIMILIVFAISALLSHAPGAGPNPLAPRVDDATTVTPRP